MGELIRLVSLSDKGRALCAIEAERASLYADARRLSEDQAKVLAIAQAAVADLGRQHETILFKMAALDEAAMKVCA